MCDASQQTDPAVSSPTQPLPTLFSPFPHSSSPILPPSNHFPLSPSPFPLPSSATHLSSSTHPTSIPQLHHALTDPILLLPSFAQRVLVSKPPLPSQGPLPTHAPLGSFFQLELPPCTFSSSPDLTLSPSQVSDSVPDEAAQEAVQQLGRGDWASQPAGEGPEKGSVLAAGGGAQATGAGPVYAVGAGPTHVARPEADQTRAVGTGPAAGELVFLPVPPIDPLQAGPSMSDLSSMGPGRVVAAAAAIDARSMAAHKPHGPLLHPRPKPPAAPQLTPTPSHLPPRQLSFPTSSPTVLPTLQPAQFTSQPSALSPPRSPSPTQQPHPAPTNQSSIRYTPPHLPPQHSSSIRHTPPHLPPHRSSSGRSPPSTPSATQLAQAPYSTPSAVLQTEVQQAGAHPKDRAEQQGGAVPVPTPQAGGQHRSVLPSLEHWASQDLQVSALFISHS